MSRIEHARIGLEREKMISHLLHSNTNIVDRHKLESKMQKDAL